MRILVTRPLPAADATAARLRTIGHQPIVLPLMRAVRDAAATQTALMRPHAAIAVTSAEAIRVIEGIGPSAIPSFQTPIFCVGAATAQAARTLGFRTVLTGQGTGQDLARQILDARIHAAMPGRVLYLAGRPRSPDFETALHQASIPVDSVDCYRMIPDQHAPGALRDLFADAPPDVVLFYARETARLFFALAAREATDAALRRPRYLCFSPSIAAEVPVGITAVDIAGKPDEDSLLRLL